MTDKDTIEKQKFKVYVKVSDGQRLLGFFFSEPSERLQDLLNDERHFLRLSALGDHLVMIANSFVYAALGCQNSNSTRPRA